VQAFQTFRAEADGLGRLGVHVEVVSGHGLRLLSVGGQRKKKRREERKTGQRLTENRHEIISVVWEITTTIV
jgi:hypothetical protein